MKASARPGALSDEEMKQYRRAWSQPRALSSMLNWYRAYLLRPVPDGSKRVTPPTTVIWGKKDVALRSVMAEESAALCDRGELIWLPENTHWVQHEAADRVNEVLITRFTN
jgi:pimeloyl-ACP methyl ester carboxylesterase